MGIILNEVRGRITELESRIGYILSGDAKVLTGHLALCRKLSYDIKAQVEDEGFSDKQDEIEFFKEVKPKLTSLYYYYGRALEIIQKIPAASVMVRERVLNDERRKLDNFAMNHQDLQVYLNQSLTHNDELYYTRQWDETELFADYQLVDLDRSYSTRKGFHTARLRAHPHLYRYINHQIQLLSNESPGAPTTSIRWIGKKVNLVTLIYGLVETKQVDTDVAKLAEVLSDVLSIELNNVYGMWQDVKMRKKEKLPFIRELDEVLSSKINDDL